jgi:hypothetical protein
MSKLYLIKGVIFMETKEFIEMPLLERANYINKLLLTFDEEPLKSAAKAVNMSYSAFCKEMRRGGYNYNQSKRQYEKTLSLDEYKNLQSSISNNDRNEEALQFISEHLTEIKELLDISKTQFILDPKVYSTESESVTKSLVVNKEIYEEFTDLCKKQFPHLRQKDILSNCLYNFIKQYSKNSI